MRAHRFMVSVGLAAALFGCGSTGPATPTHPTTKPASGPITYAKSWDEYGTPKGSVEIKKASDVRKLAGAPADFVDFVVDELATMAAQDAQFEGCYPPSITVDGIDPVIGVAKGSEGSCGEGAAVIWIRWNGRWLMAVGNQMGWGCDTLKEFLVPKAITAPTCDTYVGNEAKPVPYTGPGRKPVHRDETGRQVVYASIWNGTGNGADGAKVEKESDLSRLSSAPKDFVDFIGGQLGSCEFWIDGVNPSQGVASGTAKYCENARQIIWIRWNGWWIEALSNTGLWPCEDLKRFRVPKAIVGPTCNQWKPDGEDQVIGYEPADA